MIELIEFDKETEIEVTIELNIDIDGKDNSIDIDKKIVVQDYIDLGKYSITFDDLMDEQKIELVMSNINDLSLDKLEKMFNNA